MPKNPYKLISPQAGRHSEVCDVHAQSGHGEEENMESMDSQILKKL